MSHAPLRILLADDHPAMRALAEEFLRREPGFELVGIVATGAEAVAQAQALAPDIVVLDVSMPGLSGLEASQQIRASTSPPKVVFLSSYDHPENVEDAFASGGAAFVVKPRLGLDLVHAIRAAAVGERFVSPGIHQNPPNV